MRNPQIVVMIAMLAWCASGVAQNDDTEDSGVLEEIMVSAKRTGETRLQDTPIAISALGSEELKNRGIVKAEDLSKHVPNTTFTRHAAGDVLAFIRGVGTLSIGEGNQSSVGFYLDGVYMDRGIGMHMDFIDVERIEVLRGPQGTLFGRNATGGAVSVISASPTEELSGSFNVATGNYNQLRLNGTLSGSLSERVRGRITLSHAKRDGYLENIHPNGRDLAAQDYTGARAALEFLPNDRLNIMIRADYLKSRVPTIGNKLLAPGLFSFLANLEGVPDEEIFFDDFYKVNQNFANSEVFETKGASATITYDFPNETVLKSITSWRDNPNTFVVDTDGTSTDLVTSGGPFVQNQTTQELQLYRTMDQTTWIVGLYYVDGQDGTDGYLNRLNFVVPGATQTLNDRINWKSTALFGSVNHAFTDNLSVEAGLRYTDEEVHVPYSFVTYNIPIGDFELFDAKQSFNKATPKLGAQYTFSDDVMAYASISRGFKSGGFNSDNPPDRKFYGPEEVSSYELGLKSMLADRKVTANVALFLYDYRDLQVITTIGADDLIANAAKSTISGAEFELLARPAPAWTLNAAVSLLKAEYDSFQTLDIFGDPIDLSGGQMPYAPDWKANLGVQYDKELAGTALLTFRADVASTDDLYWNQFALQDYRQKGYTTVDALIRYTAANDSYVVELYGQNLTDEETILNAFPLPGGEGFGTIGAPLTYGIQFTYRH